MDPSNLIEYREDLAVLMRERFGQKKDRPVRYTKPPDVTPPSGRSSRKAPASW
ncbi:hypothetical protein HRW18_18415 [Streptomyces lunaelactis]|uniref:hypothetical protein n=1 Tax=Streptomyces lunaelactis TaxID=1535768 RepID=UPI0015854D28|nr:hypothetical protein [Streptomyces lunaelactis]NUK09940.1 hypothetical protein [Streptomyces lunaelactis]NUK72750.1 hypothetical protein [Streptomyces lunaelactis]NUL11404.1 hypothetical protein [Streptomyces lunaelactis]NUL25983.1 hypothetical protein [Streptomyces lunaelactis]